MAKTSYSAPAVTGAVRIIEYLCKSLDPKGVSEISQELGLNKNMTFRLLHTLQKEGWIVQEENCKYTMSLVPYHHLAKTVERMDLVRASRKPLQTLWKKTGESCYLGRVDDTKTIFLEHLDSVRTVRITASAGGRFFMHCAAPGKVLLAFNGEEFVDRVITENGLPAQTSHTHRDPESLKADLIEIRKRGYAMDLEEYNDGLICLAAPVFDYKGELAGTIGLSVLTLHYSQKELEEDLGPLVLDAAQESSAALGYQG
ncbi:MAG: IclR family transcriptional regulator [Spirochaetales bacterium]|nr:IclR family transcriptional regulator [Spirochaetales bacterium]